MSDRDNPDMELQARVEILFKLWDDIRWVFRALPKPEQVGQMSRRWVTDPPTRNIVPRLITRAAMQPMSADERVMIIQGLSAWARGYTQLVAIAALAREDRPAEMYSAATEALYECADEMARAVVSVRRDMRGKRRRHGLRPVD
jgi:hypothetical protein